jgi:hypothetical protein
LFEVVWKLLVIAVVYDPQYIWKHTSNAAKNDNIPAYIVHRLVSPFSTTLLCNLVYMNLADISIPVQTCFDLGRRLAAIILHC